MNSQSFYAFTVQLAHELRDTRIKINAIHPGWVRTEIDEAMAEFDIIEGSKTSLKFATPSPMRVNTRRKYLS